MVDRTEQEKRDYNKGWRYSSRPGCTLDHGDAIGASDAWYDGYFDMAAGRPKWSTHTLDNGEAERG